MFKYGDREDKKPKLIDEYISYFRDTNKQEKVSLVRQVSEGVTAAVDGTVGLAKGAVDVTVETSKAVAAGTVDVVSDPVKAAGDATTAVVDTSKAVAAGTVQAGMFFPSTRMIWSLRESIPASPSFRC